MISRLLERRRYMREHRWTHAHLSDYLDDEIESADKRRVEEHASICPQCRRVLATLRHTLARLGELRTEPSIDVVESVIGRLRERG